MVIGPFINASAVLAGGVIGALLSQRLPERIRVSMTSIFGLASLGIQNYVAIIVLFCASGTGIFGAMREGMTGDPSILIAKSFLDFFTAMIFACSLGIAVSAISAPMLLSSSHWRPARR